MRRFSLRPLGPAASLLLFLAAGLALLSASRLALALWQWPRLHEVAGAWRMFALGLRLDVVLLCYLLALPALLQLLLPAGAPRRHAVAAGLTLASLLVLVMEMLTPAFLAQFDRRPDRTFFEYLVYPREVFSMLAKTYPWLILVLPALALAAAALAWRFWQRSLAGEARWPYAAQLAALVVALPALLLGARGVDHRPINLSLASFSPNRLANELALNSTYSLAYAAYVLRQEADSDALYGTMPWPEVLARVRKYMGVPAAAFTDPDIPTLHRQPAVARPRPLNLVIVLEESLGAAHVGRLGGLPLTPNLVRQAVEGLWFTHLYATGTRTARGMEAVAAGFPPTPAPAVLKLPRAQDGFFTLGALLKRHGYATEFIYGGVANFDNMRGFYLNNGFDRVIEQEDFADPAFLGSWGVSDEDWVAKAHETFLAHGDAPFFALMLSTSNHEPFEYPPGRIEPYEQPAATRYNAMKYADYALGRFFELARGAGYFDHTLFVVLADHEARVYGSELLPARHFRVPAVILGPGVPRGTYDAVASQIDLVPTLLPLLGLATEHPMIGRDLLALPAGTPGRALMQFEGTHGFRVGERMVVHAPQQLPASFGVGPGDALTPVADDPELTRDALAHALWASRTYRERRYRLPRQPEFSAAR
ncbi:MAG: LTA synthase family protein [Gammaproteobacteria bacterium]